MTALGTSNTTISIGNIVLNSVDGNGVKWVVNPDGFDGWGSGDTTLAPVSKPRQSGAWGGTAYVPERYLSVRGTVYAPTPELLNTSLDNLYANVSLTPTVFSVVEAGNIRTMMVRRKSMVAPVRVNNRVAAFSFQVVALDPRKLGLSAGGWSYLPSSSGGLTVPFTVPYNIPAVTVAGQVSLTNPGNAVGPVVIQIFGPCVGPVITHAGAGAPQVFALNGLTINAGEYVTVDMDHKTVLANNIASRTTYITSRGWSGFDPGPNVWSFAAAVYTSGYFQVIATPAWQ